MRVLIIEDHAPTAQTIEMALTKKGMVCDVADLGNDGLEITDIYEYDLIILDVMLPDTNGFDVLQTLRSNKKQVPVLILSGLGSSEDKIKGLGYGADDYLTKPFDVNELIARVQAIVRRSQGHSESIVEVGSLRVNIDNHMTTFDGVPLPVPLTSKEQAVLEILAMRKGHLVTKEQFLNHLYNGMDEPEFKIVDVFICKMRKKLEKASNGDNYIGTVWGRGYVLREPELKKD
ncbi:MAG: response regulator transcription factor [Alphaproteobacteria bacterium]|jgi:two-component system cell cycle response regulator CtrA|nr:response regulator transcription factor [Candidatus Jidaibacter sp.]